MKQAVQEQEQPGLYGPSQFLGRPKAKFTVRAVDPDNQPFPGLYNAGKLGSFWGWMYNGGGNNAEALCIVPIVIRDILAKKIG
jgi:hypothetical protein